MTVAASDVCCYEAGLEAEPATSGRLRCPTATPDNLWYRFIVTDGTDTDYYADNTAALDGGLGSATDDPIDNSYALMVYDPAFTAPAWAQSAGDLPDLPRSLPQRPAATTTRRPAMCATTTRCWQAAVGHAARRLLPQLCRCATPTAPGALTTRRRDWSPTIEAARAGAITIGGDLKGVDQQLDYLKSLGVNTDLLQPDL